jgi:hypothetical protein
MKSFKNEINKKEFTNRYGEKMIMVMSANCSIWIYHEDCNEDFEKIGEGFDYILNIEEETAIYTFLEECKNILN